MKVNIASLTHWGFNKKFKNQNYYQRAYFGSRLANLLIFHRKDQKSNLEIVKRSKIIISIFKNKILHSIYLILWISTKGKQENIDVLITEASYLSLIGYFAKLFLETKWVVDLWDIPFRNLKLSFLSKSKRRLQLLFFRPLFKKADLFIVSILPDFQLKEFKLPEQKMRCFTNAIFLDEYENLPTVELFEEFTILIQRSQFYKGFGLNLILQAFELVLKKIDAQLLIVGQIMPEAKILIDRFPLKERIIETDFVEHKEFKRLTLKSHVCAIPYPKIVDLQQIYPIKAIEFMALGKAIVYTGIEGLSRIIGESGLVVKEITPQNIADKIIYLHDHPEKRIELGKKAKERSKLFDAKVKNEKIFKEIQDLFEK